MSSFLSAMSCPCPPQPYPSLDILFLQFQLLVAVTSSLGLVLECTQQGFVAFVLIDSTKDNTEEKGSPANLSLRGYEIIDVAKDALERQFPGVVSCVDILAMAARDAVFFAGGPVYEMPKGRKDGRRSKIEDTINLHAPTLNNSELIRMFAQLGFTAQEMVALSAIGQLTAPATKV